MKTKLWLFVVLVAITGCTTNKEKITFVDRAEEQKLNNPNRIAPNPMEDSHRSRQMGIPADLGQTGGEVKGK